jgi:serine/threonine protein kinase
MWKPNGQLVQPAEPAPTVRLPAGAVLGGRYRVLDLLGEGGMGLVYAAVHIDLDKRFAVKLIRPELARSPGLEDVFRNEARAVSRLGHPNIVDVSDFGRAEDGSLFMVMEYLQGESLRARLERVRVVPQERALRILLQVAQALSAAHAAGVVHRDVKPDNVLLTRRAEEDDFAKVLDFGVAYALGGPQGAVCGTPQYMPPEQASGGAHDHRVDIFAFGVMAYETLTGRLPYEIRTPVDVLLLHEATRPPALASARAGLFVPSALEEVLRRCLDPVPEGRPSSMEEVLWALIAAGAAPLETLPEREARRLGLTPPPQSVPTLPTPRGHQREPERVIEFRDAGPPVRLELAVDPRTLVRQDTREHAARDYRRWKLRRLLVRLAWLSALGIALHQAWLRGWLKSLWDAALQQLAR